MRDRLDVWLWAVRLFPARADATEACRGGHVRLRGARAKAAATLRVGDELEVLNAAGRWRVQVKALLDKRVGAALVGDYREVLEQPPPPPPRAAWLGEALSPDPGRRPTKAERRERDRLADELAGED